MKILKAFSKKIVVLFIITIVFLPSMFVVNAQMDQQIGISPIMKVNNLDNRTETPMRLDILKVNIKVLGQIAVTTLDMIYSNDNSRVMEGEFNFPMDEGQSITRFALDINGSLREGVVVEKEQGVVRHLKLLPDGELIQDC